MDKEREAGTAIKLKFDANGLVTAVITDVKDNSILMVGHMNAEAFDKTRETGKVHFFSRSRQKLWMKGETSDNFLEVFEIRVDCDQDAVWIQARPAGPTCHTGAQSCFYRRVSGNELEYV